MLRTPNVVMSCSLVILVMFLRASMVSSQQCIFVNNTATTYSARCNVSSSDEIKVIPKQNQITSLWVTCYDILIYAKEQFQTLRCKYKTLKRCDTIYIFAIGIMYNLWKCAQFLLLRPSRLDSVYCTIYIQLL